MTPSRDIAVLGPLLVGPDGVVLGDKQRRLLSALALAANRTVTLDRLMFTLWGDAAGANAATAHSHISRLRRHLERACSGARIETAARGYRLVVEAAGMDALQFEDLLGRARARKPIDPERLSELRTALGLWRGPAFTDLADDDEAQAEAARLEELRVGAYEDLADTLLDLGRPGEAQAELETLVRRYPYRDRLWSALILARYRAGRQAEALDAYQVYRRALDEELGLEPSAALVQLHRDVLEQAPHLLRPDPVPAPEIREPPPAPELREPAGTGPVTELKLVTVLALAAPDGRSLTDALTRRGGDPPADPEQRAEALDALVARLVSVVHELGGTVLQADSSGVTSVFGAPAATEDHALRACVAAERLVHEPAETIGLQSLSAAIESGQVVLKAFRTDTAQGYDAVGSPVDRARAGQRTAPAGTVLVGPGTSRLTEGLLVTTPLGAGPGPAEPGGEWRALASVASSSTWEARARRGLTTFVGRERELSALLRLVDAVKAGSGQVVGVVGDPGVGKSRLVYELTRRVPALWAVQTVAANPLDVAVPFRPLLGPIADLRARGRTSSGPADRDRETALGSLLEVAEQSPALDAWERLDPGVRRRRTISAIADLLIDQAAEGPLLLVVEDAHWLDGESLAVLDTLVDRISSAQVLLVVTYRPEHDPGWSNRPQFELVRLSPLSVGESGELAGSLLGDHPSVAPLRRQLATWTGGVPLFLEESVRELLEGARLNGAPGHYVLDLDAPPLRLSARIHGVIAARIDRLPAGEKRLLQAAAVIGFEGDVTLLAAVLGVDPDQVDRDLPGLQRADLLFERRSRGRRHYVFKHALVLDTAYASLARSQRRLMHARVMDALAGDPDAYGGTSLERLAYHATQAERWAESLDLNRRAGERALHRCAYLEAGALLTQALEAQRRLPPDVDREIELLIQLRPALHAVSDIDTALQHLVRAEELAANTGPDDRLVHILLNRAYLLVTRGDLREGVPVAERALDLAQRLGDPLLVAESRLAVGQGLVFGGDPAGTVAVLAPDMAVRMAAPLDERLGMAGTRPVFAQAWIAIATAMLGDFATAEEHVAHADRLGRLVDRPIDLVVGALARGVLELERERPLEALPALEVAQARCADAGMSLIGRWVTPVLAQALTELGEYERAEGWLLDVLRAGESSRVPLWETAGHVGLARVALALGEPDVAAEHATRAGELAAAWGYPATTVISLHLLARAADASGQPERAAALAAEALAEADRIGLRPEAARIRRIL